MGLKRLILLVVGFFYVFCSSAQIRGEYVQSRILIVLDESSSMIQPWVGGKQKYKAAHDIIMKLMDSVYAVNKDVEFGLRVFGHQHTVPENDCYDTKNEVPFSMDNKNQMLLRLEDIHPLGVTPIAYALKEAADKDLVDESHNAYSIILITDGGESCGGDLCEVMKTLVNNKVYFRPYIVSLENDPTLKATYACMGDFLQVTREADIPRAVKTIVDAFRPALKMTKRDFEEIQANIPSVLKVSAPGTKWDVPADIPKVPAVALRQLPVVLPEQKRIMAMTEAHLPPVVKEEPRREAIAGLPLAGKIASGAAEPGFKKINAIKMAVALPPVAKDTLIKHEVIARLRPLPLRQFYGIFVVEDHAYSTRPVPPLPPVKAEKAPQVVAEKADSKKPEYKVEAVDNTETTVEVYLTNGAGKFYTTNPQVLLLDPKTKEIVKRFYRYVGPDGNPDPQTGIPPGIYDLTFATNRNFILPGVAVLPNKTNKITVVVKTTTLSFAYDEPPFNAIKENWVATVTERNKTQGRVQDQKMNEQMKYEPGNYHIEVNTFPRIYRNVDLDFDFETVITIDHPGFAKFVPTDAKTVSVTLYQRLGDKFVGFYTLDLGDPRSQHLQIQPGEYQAHFQKGPGQGNAAEHVVVFHIKPNEETTVELK